MENITAVNLEGIEQKLTRVSFDEIEKEDFILHLVQSDEELFGWVGRAYDRGKNTNQWFGCLTERSDFTISSSGVLTSVNQAWLNSLSGIDRVVSADWHATEEGHSIFRIEV